MNIKRVFEQSGLTKIEMAALFGVSRQTIHGWVTGTAPIREGTLLARQREVIAAALEGAIAKGVLPLGAMARDARQERVRRMAARLQSIRIPPVKD